MVETHDCASQNLTEQLHLDRQSSVSTSNFQLIFPTFAAN
jgi:hypothetical protein